MPRPRALLLVLGLMPAKAGAVGPEDAPPSPTGTTTTCSGKLIWDPDTRRCLAPESARLDDEARFRAARELAFVGRPDAALAVLDAMTEGPTDRVLTYRGFAYRAQGDAVRAGAAYAEALRLNPDNLMARSYLGQGLVEAGDVAGARAQLSEIRARGGRQTRAEFALRQAIATGRGVAW